MNKFTGELMIFNARIVLLIPYFDERVDNG